MEPQQNLDVLYEILYRSDYDTVINYCRTHYAAQFVCRDPIFWQQKAELNFGTTPQEFRNTNLGAAQRYLQLFTDKGGLSQESHRYMHMDLYIKRAIRQGRDDLVQHAINNLGYKNMDVLTQEYAEKNNRPMVDYYLAKGDYLNEALTGSLEGGHRELFDYLLALAPADRLRWDSLLYSAAISGNISLFDHVLSLKPSTYNFSWDTVVDWALNSKSKAMFDHILSLIPPDMGIHWSNKLGISLLPGRQQDLIPGYDWRYLGILPEDLQLFNYVRSLVPESYPIDWTTVLVYAIYSTKQSLFDHVYSLVPPDYHIEWTELLQAASHLGRRDLFDHVYSLIPPGYPVSWLLVLLYAIRSRDSAFFDHVLSLVPAGTPIDWIELASSAARNGSKDILARIFALAPPGTPFHWVELIVYANIDSYASKSLIDYILSQIPLGYPLNWNDVLGALARRQNVDDLVYILSKVPSNYVINWLRLLNEAQQYSTQAMVNAINQLSQQ